MKRFLALSLLVAFFAGASAQTFVVHPSDSIYYPLDPGHGAEIYFHFVNTSPQPITLQWERLGGNYPTPQWTMLLCDNKECFPGTHSGDTMATIVSGDSAFFKLISAPNGVAAVGTLDLRVWDTMATSYTVDVHYIVDALNTGTPKPSLEQTVLVFPTIVRDRVQLQARSGHLEKGVVRIYDTKGHVVASEPIVAQRSQHLEVRDLMPGIYLLRYETRGGQLVRKIVVEQ